MARVAPVQADVALAMSRVKPVQPCLLSSVLQGFVAQYRLTRNLPAL